MRSNRFGPPLTRSVKGPAVCTLAVVCCLASAGLAYTGANISVYDIDSSDVPGPQPIRVFPVPAAAGWTDATLIYDNYSEGLPFSAGINYDDLSWVDLPLANADVTINGLDYLAGVSNVAVDNSFQLLTNEEGDDSDIRADDRFPYHIPRPSRYCGEWFTAVQFDLADPAGTFGVFLPGATNIHSTENPPDDHNFVKMTQSVHVLIQGEGDSLAQAQHEYVSLYLGNGSYCPFLMVEWNGNTPITAVSVIHDCYADHSPTFGFMDVYACAPPAATPGDANYDGWIDGNDYTLWADNYEPGVGGKTWGQGDFSGDGIVDGTDYTLWATYYTGAPDVPGPPILLPEPAALGLLAAGMFGLIRRRRG